MNKKIIGIAAGVSAAAIAGILFLTRRAQAAQYSCPMCDATFSTLEELEAHFSTEHPAEPIEIIWT